MTLWTTPFIPNHLPKWHRTEGGVLITLLFLQEAKICIDHGHVRGVQDMYRKKRAN